VVATFSGVNILLNGDEILKNFVIKSVTNNFTKFTVEYESVPAAEYYRIAIISEDERKVFETTSTDTKVDMELTNLINNKEYSLMVYAYDKLGDSRPAKEDYTFIWNEPTIKSDSSILLDNKDYTLNIDGKLEGEKYTIQIKSGSEELVKESLTTNSYVIPNKYYKDQMKELEVFILSGDTPVDSIKLFNKMNPITDIKITSISEGQTVPVNDLSLVYEGGENASNYKIEIFKDGNLIRTTNTTKRQVIVSSELFEISKNYKFKITASYGKFSKSSEVNVVMSDKEQHKPVYISSNWKYVKKGSKITLDCRDKDATIYYTLDGKSPESFGIVYKEPITINENVTLKTVAVSDDKYNSEIKTYNINVGEKTNLAVYISPSNQHGNLGVSSVGYTNEMDEMNDLSDYIIERLKAHGVKVYRNNSSGNINLWLRDSNYYGVDLHLAVHSNASTNHDNHGIETWIHSEGSNTFSLGNMIQDNLASIYPYKDRKNYDRGVKYANGALGEVNDNYLPFGILIEVAHHDDKQDAEWIMQNKKLIGYNIADSILK
ncbi:MAG: chitobiase/beta-hexosaminidase C-terminal domain-containing protein, partial [Bacilli bacterium]|nr:chitobiase/beta-hexosaminidase C-terminal domain-containing protein [Bacilli bacterium]